MVYKLSEQMKEIIQEKTGLTPEQISSMDHDEVRKCIEEHTSRKITEFGVEPGSITRNMLTALGEVVTPEEIDAELEKI